MAAKKKTRAKKKPVKAKAKKTPRKAPAKKKAKAKAKPKKKAVKTKLPRKAYTVTKLDTRFQPGNQLWKRRKNPGRKRIIETPQELEKIALEYFAHMEENPLYTLETHFYEGEARAVALPKMRAMVLQSFYLFAGIKRQTFFEYEKLGGDWEEVCEWIRNVIYTQKFEGAAADMLNVTIISRDLKLYDSVKNKHDISDNLGQALKDVLTRKRRTSGDNPTHDSES